MRANDGVSFKKIVKSPDLGQEPSSSGYGTRLASEGYVFESQYRILDGHFSP